MMKILIMYYCADPNQIIVADTLKNRFDELGHFCVIKDLALYRFENHGNNELAFTSGLFDDLHTGEYDTIVFLHDRPARVFTRIKLIKKIDIKSFFIQTDYTIHSDFSKFCVDMFFVPNDTLVKDYISLGIPSEKISVGGVPSVTFNFSDSALLHSDKFCLILADGYDSSDVLEITQKSKDVLNYDMSFAVLSFDSNQYRIYGRFSDIYENFLVYSYEDIEYFKHLCKPDVIISNSNNVNLYSAMRSGVPVILFDADGKPENFTFLSKLDCFTTCKSFNDVFDALNLRFYERAFGLMLAERGMMISRIDSVRTVCENIINFNNKTIYEKR